MPSHQLLSGSPSSSSDMILPGGSDPDGETGPPRYCETDSDVLVSGKRTEEIKHNLEDAETTVGAEPNDKEDLFDLDQEKMSGVDEDLDEQDESPSGTDEEYFCDGEDSSSGYDEEQVQNQSDGPEIVLSKPRPLPVSGARPKKTLARTSKEWHAREKARLSLLSTTTGKRKSQAKSTTCKRRKTSAPQAEPSNNAPAILRQFQHDPIEGRNSFVGQEAEKSLAFEAYSKGEQFNKLSELAGGSSDPKKNKAEVKQLERDARSFGLNNCRPVNGAWKITGMKTTVHNHQMQGASWMLGREFDDDKGGILADEMGLGKTITTLVTIMSNRPTAEDEGHSGQRPSLCVVPSNITTQWVDEIMRHSEAPKVVPFQACAGLPAATLQQMDVIVVSYGQLCSEFDRFKTGGSVLFGLRFWRVVLDEAHVIKNPKTKRFKACCALDAEYRWVLTGTPLHNTTDELWSYIDFLRITWAKSCPNPRDILARIMLRRTTSTTIVGKAIATQPPGHREVKIIPFSREEAIIHRVILSRCRELSSEALKNCKRDSPRSEDYQKAMDTLGKFALWLRQGSAHPYLLEPFLKEHLTIEDLQTIKTELSEMEVKAPVYKQIPEIRDDFPGDEFGRSKFGFHFAMARELDLLEAAIRSRTGECDMCNGCGRAIEGDKAMRIECGHVFSIDCFDDLARKQSNKTHKSGEANCPECAEPISGASEVDTGKETSVAVKSEGGSGKIKQEDEADQMAEFRRFQAQMRRWQASGNGGKTKTMLSDPGKDRLGARPSIDRSKLRWLAEADNNHPEPVVPSAKMTMVKSIVLKWQREAPEDKIVIFTQFLGEHQIIGRMLAGEDIEFVYYYGDLSPTKKNRAVKEFEKPEGAQVMIISLASGAVGLNLQFANRVILTSPWWNRCIEQQACGRVFRTGQKKETYFVKILMEGSIDMKIQQTQEEKHESIREVIDYDEQHEERPPSKLEDLASLFGLVTRDEGGNFKLVSDENVSIQPRGDGDE